MAWKLALGNLITRAPAFGVAASSTEDPYFPLSEVGNGYPDDPARWLWESDGGYSADFDLNLLAQSSERADAPTGWRDLALTLAGTPGLGANPPVFGTFDTRPDTIKFYGPVFQDIEVMPGEDLLFEGGLRFPAAATGTTGVKVVVVNLKTGKQRDGVLDAWNNSADPLGEETTVDTWNDVSETITNESEERVTYRVILTPTSGGPFGPLTYAYVSTPAVTAAQNFVALIGHNLPVGATVAWDDGASPRTILPLGSLPSVYALGASSSQRFWSLDVTMPANTTPWHGAPFVGELWAGRLVDMVACPGYPFDIIEGDIAQVRLEGGLGRESIFTEIEHPTRAFKMRFKTTNDSQYEDARDAFLRASRFGADPVILVPVEALEGVGVIWHGRVGPEVTYARTSLTKRTFEISLRESPFPRFR